MNRYVIHGGRPLHGEIEISGAKNAAVAIIPAALMVDGVCRIENMPQISDVDMLLKILQGLGARVEYLSPSAVEIDCTQVRFTEPPYDLMRKIRASYYFIGSMLGRFGSAKTTMPGGCNFGVRPIDQHIKGMTAMGANVEVKNGFVYADTPDGRLHGAKVYLDKVSVGATMNIIIAATLARGRTVIENAAREPHIVDLANFLNSMGADIRGAGTDSIRIQGVERLHGGTYSVIPDQIEAGTYMAAAAAVERDPAPSRVHQRKAARDGRDRCRGRRQRARAQQRPPAPYKRQDPAVPRLPDGYAAADQRGAVPGRRHERRDRGRV